MSFRVTVLPGDGIGPEVAAAAVEVMTAAARLENFEIAFEHRDFGGAAIDSSGDPFPDDTLKSCQGADAVLLGAVGGPTYDEAARKGVPRPESGLLALREKLGLFANLRPSRLFRGVEAASPLRSEIVEGLDVLVVRELTGGVYFGERTEGRENALDTMPYSRDEVERVVRVAFEAARLRKSRLTSVDKANVLATSRLWRATVDDLASEYSDVSVEHVLVDAMAMHLVTHPARFDVVVTENLFGDILSDELSAIAGSIGLAASASLGASGTPAVYEPIHGSAPDIAGLGIANPIGSILSGAMLFRQSGMSETGADRIEAAVAAALDDGLRTRDIGGSATTEDAVRAILARL